MIEAEIHLMFVASMGEDESMIHASIESILLGMQGLSKLPSINAIDLFCEMLRPYTDCDAKSPEFETNFLKSHEIEHLALPLPSPT